MGRMIAKVAVAKALYAIDKPYDYFIPEELEPRIQPGVRVLVPFGRGNRGSDGIVLSVYEGASGGVALKMIRAQLDEKPVLNEKMLQLALWMRERCFCTVYDCVKVMLPAGLYFSLRDSISLVHMEDEKGNYAAVESVSGGAKLLDLLYIWGGKGDMEQIRLAWGVRDPNPTIRGLIQSGIVTLETSTQRGIGDKTEKLAVLAVPAEEAMAMVNKRSAPMRYAVTELLCTLEVESPKVLCYLTGASKSVIRDLEKKGILRMKKQEVFRRINVESVDPAEPPVLNEEQQAAFDGLRALAQGNAPAAAMLYGVTGSGKTQVYIRLIRDVLAQGRTALVLVPEIILTPQLLRIFTSHFGDKIAVLHSALHAGERYDEWKRARSGAASVVIGTRSAVFAPVENLGLIILDEEQETSYKSENVPRYHAREIAKYRCYQHNALLVLGSATPCVESMYQVQQGRYHLFTLKKRFNQKPLPEVMIVDMKQELRQGNNTSISSVLARELADNIQRGEQSILFLNRRGSSRLVSCGECGEVPECPRCSVKLTYHSANERLMCHYCGYSQKMFRACPNCGGQLNFVGIGTQRVQEDLEELFPGTEILRMDTDTVSASHPHEELLARFRKENIPILVGTQMVAKGLDFENVTLVGAVAPDLSLYIDDFRAGERTFGLLTQVVGRAGRGERQGRAIIQTYTPQNDVICFSAKQDYGNFYRTELPLRRLRHYPPFSDVVVITVSSMDEVAILRCCYRLRKALDASLHPDGWQVLGPAPAAVLKVNNRFRYRLTIIGKLDKNVRGLIAHLLRAAHQDKDNKGVSVYADVDPY